MATHQDYWSVLVQIPGLSLCVLNQLMAEFDSRFCCDIIWSIDWLQSLAVPQKFADLRHAGGHQPSEALFCCYICNTLKIFCPRHLVTWSFGFVCSSAGIQPCEEPMEDQERWPCTERPRGQGRLPAGRAGGPAGGSGRGSCGGREGGSCSCSRRGSEPRGWGERWWGKRCHDGLVFWAWGCEQQQRNAE